MLTIYDVALNLDGLLATQPPKEDTSQGAVLICRLIDWLYRIATEAGLAEEAQLPNNMLDNYQSCLVWYEKALKQQGESSFIQYVTQTDQTSMKLTHHAAWFTNSACSFSSDRSSMYYQHLAYPLRAFAQNPARQSSLLRRRATHRAFAFRAFPSSLYSSTSPGSPATATVPWRPVRIR